MSRESNEANELPNTEKLKVAEKRKEPILMRLNKVLMALTVINAFFTVGVAVGRKEIILPYIQAGIKELQSLILEQEALDEQETHDEIPTSRSLVFTETTSERLQSLLSTIPEEAFIERQIQNLCTENNTSCSFERPSTNELLNVAVYKDLIEGGSPRYRIDMRDTTRLATYTISFTEEDGVFYVDDHGLYIEDDTLLTLVELAKHLKENGVNSFKFPMRVHDITLKDYYRKTILETPSTNGPKGGPGAYFPEYQVVIPTGSGERVYIVTPDRDKGGDGQFTKSRTEVLRITVPTLLERMEDDIR